MMNKKLMYGLGAMAVLAAAGGVGYYAVEKYNLTDPYGCYISDSAIYDIHQQQVASRLKAPLSAKFPDIKDIKISHDKTCEYTIEGYVDSQNAYGALIRMSYISIMTKQDGSYKLDGLYDKKSHPTYNDFIDQLLNHFFFDVKEAMGVDKNAPIQTDADGSRYVDFKTDDGVNFHIAITPKLDLVDSFSITYEKYHTGKVDTKQMAKVATLSMDAAKIMIGNTNARINKDYLFNIIAMVLENANPDNSRGKNKEKINLGGFTADISAYVSRNKSSFSFYLDRIY